INLNKGFPFVRKFAAYSLQIWRKLDRPRQRRLQNSLLAFKTLAWDVPQGIGCHVLSIADGFLAWARVGPVAERRFTTAPRQSGRGLGGDFCRVRNRGRLASILRASTGRLHGRFSCCKPTRFPSASGRPDALSIRD